MNKRILGMLLALTMLVPSAPVIASHTNNYVTMPQEHDDQGRSNEPDFATTSVLGTLVVNKIYDPTPNNASGAMPDTALPPVPPGRSPKLAPGCTDDTGPKPSGLCGLWTIGANPLNAGANLGPGQSIIPAKTVGVQGMTNGKAPGRFSDTAGTPVRFLDMIAPTHISPPAGGVQYIEVNRKLDDTGARAALSAVAPDFATDYLIGYTGMWAWYGVWTDKNGNGVLDELGPSCSTNNPDPAVCPLATLDDEWYWVGNCLQFPSGLGLVRADNCKVETTQMLGWVYPGNHHTFSGGSVAGQGVTSALVPADFPFRQAICAADIFQSRKVNLVTDGFIGNQNPMACPGRYEDLESWGVLFYGDTFLDDQTGTLPDFAFADRAGDPNIGTRQYVAGNGFSMPFYDQSLLQSTVAVTAVFSPLSCVSPCDGRVNLGAAQYTDVDKFNSVAPVLSDLLLTVVKPASRANWIVVRDQLTAADNANDKFLANAAINRDPIKGPLNGITDPGYSHEPNHPADIISGAVFGRCADSDANHYGWCNDYSAFKTAKRAYIDALGFRVGTSNFVLTVNNNGQPVGLACILCVAGGGFPNPIPDGTPKPAGTDKHARSFAPGNHLFGGNLGGWIDRPQVITDLLYDPTCLLEANPAAAGCGGPSGLLKQYSYTIPADGWVGSIVNSTGYYRYRGYTTDTCTINGVSAVRDYAICHPNRDGIISNPQAYTSGNSIGEFFGACVAASFDGVNTPLKNSIVIDITPLDENGNPGTWKNPTFLNRNWFNQRPDVAKPELWTAKMEDWTGKGTIRLSNTCNSITSGAFGFNDLLILPVGNLGQNVMTTVTARPNMGTTTAPVYEVVRDVDVYVGWSA
jgi:hypothetical protein